MGSSDPDGSPTPLRNETDIERMDRNYVELLQELRVAQTGTQILFAFLLSMAFTGRFGQITGLQEVLYVVALVAAALASGALIGPVSFHRLLFRRRRKPELVMASHVMAIVGLALLALALICSVMLVLDFVLDGWLPFALTAFVAVWFVGLWYVLPQRYRS